MKRRQSLAEERLTRPVKGGGAPFFAPQEACQRRTAFSLIELLTVMGLILILTALILGAGVYARNKALRSRAMADIEKIHKALQEYQMQYKKFSPTATAWKGFPYPVTASADAAELAQTMVTNWLPATFTFRDPWKRPYQYLYDVNSPNTYSLYSRGAKADISADDIYSEK